MCWFLSLLVHRSFKNLRSSSVWRQSVGAVRDWSWRGRMVMTSRRCVGFIVTETSGPTENPEENRQGSGSVCEDEKLGRVWHRTGSVPVGLVSLFKFGDVHVTSRCRFFGFFTTVWRGGGQCCYTQRPLGGAKATSRYWKRTDGKWRRVIDIIYW